MLYTFSFDVCKIEANNNNKTLNNNNNNNININNNRVYTFCFDVCKIEVTSMTAPGQLPKWRVILWLVSPTAAGKKLLKKIEK